MIDVRKKIRDVFYNGPTKGIYEALSDFKRRKIYALCDEEYIKYAFEKTMGYKIDLDNPKTLSEKLNWLKLHDRRPEYTKMVDKYAVKDYVREMVGEEYLIPTLGVWDDFDEIVFSSLPDKFVLKATHDSGSIVVCDNKESFDKQSARSKLRRSLKKNFYLNNREYPYKDVRPRIIAEPYIDSLGKADSVEYKLSIFNGKVRMLTVCKGIAHSTFDVRTNDHYDRDGNILPFYAYYKNSEVPLPLPDQAEEMIYVAETISKDIPYVRVDFYVIDEKVKFGEMTFFTWGGFIKFVPEEYDTILGSWLELPRGDKI